MDQHLQSSLLREVWRKTGKNLEWWRNERPHNMDLPNRRSKQSAGTPSHNFAEGCKNQGRTKAVWKNLSRANHLLKNANYKFNALSVHGVLSVIHEQIYSVIHKLVCLKKAEASNTGTSEPRTKKINKKGSELPAYISFISVLICTE